MYTIYQFWIPTSKELYEQSEIELLKHYEIKNYQISNNGRIAYIIYPNPSKPTLILNHGYGQTKVSWMETIPKLIPHFHIIAIDSPGNGGCERPRFSSTMAFKTSYDAEQYFSECFEEFRKELNLTDFILLGHSIGGYLAGTYALNHPEHIRQLILLSPYGLVPKPSEEEIEKWSSFFKNVIRFGHWVKRPPQYFARFLGPLGKWGVVRGYFRRRFPSRDPQDPWIHLFGNNTYYNAALPFGYEGFFHAIIGYPVHAKTCLAPRLENLEIPVAFIYGEHDWMHPECGLEVHCKLIQKKIPSIFKTIKGANHQVYFGKPMGFISTLIETCKELENLKNGPIKVNSIDDGLDDSNAI